MIEAVRLAHGNKCTECGHEFQVEAPLRPITTEDREFYGGRISFFKEAKCICGKRYDLCIERKYNHKEEREDLIVIDMIELDGEDEKVNGSAILDNAKLPTNVMTLSTLEKKMETLDLYTMKELRQMCKDRGIPFKVTEGKLALQRKLVEKEPNLVVAP